MRKRIELLQRQAKEEDEALFSELSAEFDRLRALLDERITRLRSEREANAAALQEGAAPAFSALAKRTAHRAGGPRRPARPPF